MPLNNTIQTFIAGGAITEFALVSLDGAGKVQITTVGTDKACVGIAQRAVASGDAVEVVTAGLSKVIAGGAITAATDPRLKAVTGTTGKVETVATGDFAVCRMISNTNQFTAADGDQILVMFVGPTVVEP